MPSLRSLVVLGILRTSRGWPEPLTGADPLPAALVHISLAQGYQTSRHGHKRKGFQPAEQEGIGSCYRIVLA